MEAQSSSRTSRPRDGEIVEYRRRPRSNIWHWRGDCQYWPSEGYFVLTIEAGIDLAPIPCYRCIELDARDIPARPMAHANVWPS